MSAAADIYKSAGFEARKVITTVRDVSAAEFIKAYAAHLKKSNKLKLPEWVDVVKTASGRELAPLDPDWYYVRAASIARKVYLHDGIGVGALSHWYGKAKAKGVTPKHHHTASRAVIRHILINVRLVAVAARHHSC
jgi:small subunit ribosomal protein S19e